MEKNIDPRLTSTDGYLSPDISVIGLSLQGFIASSGDGWSYGETDDF